MDHDDRVEAFLAEFNQLHKAMQAKTGKQDDFFSLLKRMEKTDSVIRRYKDELHLTRKLRNLLVHEKQTIAYDIAIPSEEALQALHDIRIKFEYPETASTFEKKVYSFNINDSLFKLLEAVNRYQISHFPIFDDHQLQGVMSHNGITHWIGHEYQQKIIDLTKVQLSDIVEAEDTYMHYDVIIPETPLYLVEQLFQENLLAGRNLFVILIATKKKITQADQLKGIITSNDLPRVLQSI